MRNGLGPWYVLSRCRWRLIVIPSALNDGEVGPYCFISHRGRGWSATSFSIPLSCRPWMWPIKLIHFSMSHGFHIRPRVARKLDMSGLGHLPSYLWFGPVYASILPGVGPNYSISKVINTSYWCWHKFSRDSEVEKIDMWYTTCGVPFSLRIPQNDKFGRGFSTFQFDTHIINTSEWSEVYIARVPLHLG